MSRSRRIENWMETSLRSARNSAGSIPSCVVIVNNITRSDKELVRSLLKRWKTSKCSIWRGMPFQSVIYGRIGKRSLAILGVCFVESELITLQPRRFRDYSSKRRFEKNKDFMDVQKASKLPCSRLGLISTWRPFIV